MLKAASNVAGTAAPKTDERVGGGVLPSVHAIQLAASASDMLTALGVSVRIVGSLARSRYVEGSDIDFLIENCPRHLKYAIEGRVEDCLLGHPFDVIYLDEIPPAKRRRFVEDAVHARHLR